MDKKTELVVKEQQNKEAIFGYIKKCLENGNYEVSGNYVSIRLGDGYLIDMTISYQYDTTRQENIDSILVLMTKKGRKIGEYNFSALCRTKYGSGEEVIETIRNIINEHRIDEISALVDMIEMDFKTD